jgi:RNA polymerase sporulation-specific sigma factor
LIDECEVNELLDRVSVDDEALNELFIIYYAKIYRMASFFNSSVKHVGVDIQDLIQEGRIGLYEAIWSYKPYADAKFTTFVHLCCQRKMSSLVKKQLRYKHRMLNDSISLHHQVGEGAVIMDFVQNKNVDDPLELLIYNEKLKVIKDEVEKNLSGLEKEIFHLKIEGFDYIEIAEVLDKPIKTIDNGLQRLKKKIKRFIY